MHDVHLYDIPVTSGMKRCRCALCFILIVYILHQFGSRDIDSKNGGNASESVFKRLNISFHL